jgi:type I restriction enzyme S subunit
LKTEHYVAEPGVRLVRLQNIGEGSFLDDEKSWISEAHARRLAKHDVQPGDVLVASLGDPTHLFARSCLYPLNHRPGIVKADCFRFRTGDELDGAFLANVLNTPRWRTSLVGQVNRSGVSRDRVNLSKLRRFEIPVPPLAEQRALTAVVDAAWHRITTERTQLEKLRLLKQGLMEDLLTGRVRVTNSPVEGVRSKDVPEQLGLAL